MKKVLFLLLGILSCIISHSQTYMWGRAFGSDLPDAEVDIVSVQMDRFPNSCWTGYTNVYFSGNFQGSIDFDPGPDSAIITSSGMRSVYLAKLDESGDFLWAKTFQCLTPASEVTVKSMEIDDSANIYMGGIFTGWVDFDPDSGSYVLSDTGLVGGDIFIAKYNYDGQLIWAKRIGGNGEESLFKLKWINPEDGIVIAGLFSDTVDFDPGPIVFEYISSGATVDGKNVFFAKYNPDGELVFAKKLEYSTQQLDFSIFSEKIYLLTNLSGDADFDPGSGVTLLQGMSESVVYAAYSEFGELIYAKRVLGAQMNSFQGNAGSAISAGLPNVYIIVGTYNNMITFNEDGNPIVLTQYEISGNVVFYAGIKPLTGECIWAKDIESDGFLNAESVILDGKGRMTIAGTFDGTCDFDPGAGTSMQNTLVKKAFMSINYGSFGGFFGVSTLEGDGIAHINCMYEAGNDKFIGGTFSGSYLDLDVSANEKFVYKQGQSPNSIYIVKNNYYSFGVENPNHPNQNVKVLPNPSAGRVNIFRNTDHKSNYALTDPAGRVIKSGVLLSMQSSLDLEDIPAGIYFLTLDEGVLKLVIQR